MDLIALKTYAAIDDLSRRQRVHQSDLRKMDPTDAINGYVTGNDAEGRPVFDGNYRAYDGGLKDGDSGGTEPRRFYESSFSDKHISTLAAEQVTQVDAVMYTNHMLSGKMGSATINGVLVSRDEAIVYNGSIEMNYDLRIRSGGYEFLDVYLPREPTYVRLYWRESN